MSKHHEEHPDYAEMGIFAGYGEEDQKTCPFLDPEYELPVNVPCPVCGATGRIEDWDISSEEFKKIITKLCDEARGKYL